MLQRLLTVNFLTADDDDDDEGDEWWLHWRWRSVRSWCQISTRWLHHYHNISGGLNGLVINSVTVSSLLSYKRPKNTSQHQHVRCYITIKLNMVTAVRGRSFVKGLLWWTHFTLMLITDINRKQWGLLVLKSKEGNRKQVVFRCAVDDRRTLQVQHHQPWLPVQIKAVLSYMTCSSAFSDQTVSSGCLMKSNMKNLKTGSPLWSFCLSCRFVSFWFNTNLKF